MKQLIGLILILILGIAGVATAADTFGPWTEEFDIFTPDAVRAQTWTGVKSLFE